MKLLKNANAVLIPIPKFQVASKDGNLDIDFSILFKRIGNKEGKLRKKELRKSLILLTTLQAHMTADEPDYEAIAVIEAKMEKVESKADKFLFDDIIGWSNLDEDDGTNIPYSVEDKIAILDHDGFREAILGVWSMANGNVKAEVLNEEKGKNS